MSLNEKVLLKNRCKCLFCETVIESIHFHHYVSCLCGKIFTDGGNSYLKRGGDLSLIHDMSVWATPDELIYSKAESLRDAISKLDEEALAKLYDGVVGNNQPKITESKKARLCRKGFENAADDELAKLYDNLVKSEKNLFKEIENSKEFLSTYSVKFDKPVQTVWDAAINT